MNPTSADCENVYRYNLLMRTVAGNDGETTFTNPIPASINANEYSGCLVYVDSIAYTLPDTTDPPVARIPPVPAIKIYIEGVTAVNSYETANVTGIADVSGNFIATADIRPLRQTALLGVYPIIATSDIRPETKFNGNVRDNGVYIGTVIPALTSFKVVIVPYDTENTGTWGTNTLMIQLEVLLIRNTPRLTEG